jgi:hypothetical protein
MAGHMREIGLETELATLGMRGGSNAELHEWRAPQVADHVRLKGSGRYAPGQTEAGALADSHLNLLCISTRLQGWCNVSTAIDADHPNSTVAGRTH